MTSKPVILQGEMLKQEVDALNANLKSHWQLDNCTLYKRIECVDFRRTWMCVTAAALIAERLNHHPHITQCYNWLELRLSTHNPKGITSLDIAFARELESSLAELLSI